MALTWKAIGSAPKDGTKIILFCRATRTFAIGWWNATDKNWWTPGKTGRLSRPTHWGALPVPPA